MIKFTLICQDDDLECLDPELWAAIQEEKRLAAEEARLKGFAGIDQAARDAELKRQALLNKYAHLPEPDFKISQITPFGGFDMNFNQNMTMP